MEWVVGMSGIAAVAAIMWLFRAASRPDPNSLDVGLHLMALGKVHDPIRATRKAEVSSTTPDRPIPATAEAIAELFEPVSNELYECRRTARRLFKAAERALATGEVNPAHIEETEDLLKRVAMAIGRAERVMDRLVFEDENVEWLWWAFIEEIHNLEAQIEVAMSDFRIVRDNEHIFR